MSGAAGSEPPSPADMRLPAGDPLGPSAPHYPFLSPDEQELAALVYSRTAATALELVQALSPGISEGDVRAALDRLVSRQVLRESEGRGVRFYVQALRQTEIQQEAMVRLAEEHFDGSLANAARLLLVLVHRNEPEALPGLSAFMKSVLSARG